MTFNKGQVEEIMVWPNYKMFLSNYNFFMFKHKERHSHVLLTCVTTLGL